MKSVLSLANVINGVDSETENDDSSSDELLRYKMELKVPESINPIHWWKLNEHRYPKMSFLAKTI